MAKTKFDVKTEAAKVFYAGVGVNDLAVELVRDYVADVQTKVADVQKNVTSIDLDPKALRTYIEARVAALQSEAKGYPAKVQSVLTENVDTAADAFEDLVKRGETLVARIRRQESTKATVSSAKNTAAKAKTTTTQASKTADASKTAAKKAVKSTPVKKKAAAAKSSAKATATTAKKTAESAVKATGDAAAKVGD
ncbi:hypothetical protein [Nocardioides sp. 616]|uniref:hypothetical protein n=1 Tax=Nocardioides sp. 616 TaxID=2268090 RepID=UPI000CE50A8E|nr:hypothetical protein [Nocardioides sp. 616]